MKVIVYSTDNCPFCRAAKDLLTGKGIRFREVDVSEENQFDQLVQKTGWKTVPQIFIDGQLIGGFQELLQWEADGKL